MVSPAQRRTWVRWVQEAYAVSERDGVRRGRRGAFERALCERGGAAGAAATAPARAGASRVAYGYRRLHVLLRREGWPVNRQAHPASLPRRGLTQQRKRLKRRKSAAPTHVRRSLAHQRALGDGLHPRLLADGTAMRVLSVVDCYTRECVGLVPARRFRADDVAAHLSRIGARAAYPAVIQCDNGTEFTSVALDHWAYWNHVQLDFSRPGKPTDNAAIESFHNSFRRECLTQHYFMNLTEADDLIERYRWDYNNDRPHSSLGNVPPAHFRAAVAITASVSSTA
jgi:putative transposase